MKVSNLTPLSCEIAVDDKQGHVYTLPCTTVAWKTQRTDRAGSLEFTFLGGDQYADTTFELNCGDIVRMQIDGDTIFYGYVFTVENKGDGTFSATAYDQLRYLMYNNTYVFAGKTATEIIQQIAADFGITLGEIADTEYPIPKLSKDNKKLLEIISDALCETTYATKETYVLYDKAGALTLTNINDMRLPLAFGDSGMLTGYNYKESIDNETYNQIKLVQDNEEDGCRDVYIYQDSSNIANWGVLQYFGSMDSGYNAAMIEQIGVALLELHNRLEKTFKLEARGEVTCRAGAAIYIEIADLGVADYFLIENADHTFEANDHSMSLTLKVVT
ncbi:MAG: hypothetical protein H6Q60_1422 [Oscillospiraceae bacterium]|nr:hypothetical protein [Oscillospiraceae bacterium]